MQSDMAFVRRNGKSVPVLTREMRTTIADRVAEHISNDRHPSQPNEGTLEWDEYVKSLTRSYTRIFVDAYEYAGSTEMDDPIFYQQGEDDRPF